MDDHLCLVIDSFDCGVGNPEMEVVLDLLLMVSNHPGDNCLIDSEPEWVVHQKH